MFPMVIPWFSRSIYDFCFNREMRQHNWVVTIAKDPYFDNSCTLFVPIIDIFVILAADGGPPRTSFH